jgi:hypothetical protein
MLVVVFLSRNRKTRSHTSRWKNALYASSAKVFYDNAICFAFAFQAASIVILARANFGISANGMGALTMKITWSISLLTLLPILPLSFSDFLFRMPIGPEEETVSCGQPTTAEEPDNAWTLPDQAASAHWDKEDPEGRRRFFLYVLCWSLSVFPFLSRMVGTFGKSCICRSA